MTAKDATLTSDIAARDRNVSASDNANTHPARRSRAAAQTEKRSQILAAARAVFERSGYDGASMNDIATEGGVSKPTLYVYFDSKEKLFDGLIEDMCATFPETALDLDAANRDLEAVLTRCGVTLMAEITRPERVKMLRVVVGAAGKFPEVGQKFFRAGPGQAIETFKRYLQEVTERGLLVVPDADLAAYHLLDLMQSVHLRRMMLAVAEPPGGDEIERTVRAGVRRFLAAYST